MGNVQTACHVVVDPEIAAAIKKNNYLADHAHNVTSQGGEDGVISKILEILQIDGPGWCVEFGACDGKRDSNIWRLVNEKSWQAVYIEPEPSFFTILSDYCRKTPGTWCFNDLVGWEGENRLDAVLARTPIPQEFELLVIDIDGGDYYVWEALEQYRPRVVCIEFHRLISTSLSFVPSREEPENRPSSLRALCELAKKKGYELVCAINWNAFFVRNEDFSKFEIENNSPENMYFSHEEMRLLQCYDGTLRIFNNRSHYWKYQYDSIGNIKNVVINQEDIQVLPTGLRIFRPRHEYYSATLASQAGKLDAARVPGNILLQHRRNDWSENGEDGILDYIFDCLGIGSGTCVDIGACDGILWSNTRNLIVNNKWSALLIEKETESFEKLRETYKGHETVLCAQEAVNSDQNNIDSILKKHDIPLNFDLLSIDVEGNEYHILHAMNKYTPTVLIVDFNPSMGNDVFVIQKDDADVHVGGSLRAFIDLGRQKGYQLAAVTDWNAIFVRDEFFPVLDIADNRIDQMYVPPFEMRMFQTLDGCTHLYGFTTLARQDHKIGWEEFQILPKSLRGRDTSAAAFGKTISVFYDRKLPENSSDHP